MEGSGEGGVERREVGKGSGEGELGEWGRGEGSHVYTHTYVQVYNAHMYVHK